VRRSWEHVRGIRICIRGECEPAWLSLRELAGLLTSRFLRFDFDVLFGEELAFSPSCWLVCCTSSCWPLSAVPSPRLGLRKEVVGRMLASIVLRRCRWILSNDRGNGRVCGGLNFSKEGGSMTALTLAFEDNGQRHDMFSRPQASPRPDANRSKSPGTLRRNDFFLSNAPLTDKPFRRAGIYCRCSCVHCIGVTEPAFQIGFTWDCCPL